MRDILKIFLVAIFILSALIRVFRAGKLYAGGKIVYEGVNDALIDLAAGIVYMVIAFLILFYL